MTIDPKDRDFSQAVFDQLDANKIASIEPNTQAELSSLTKIHRSDLSKLLALRFGDPKRSHGTTRWSAQQRDAVARAMGLTAWLVPEIQRGDGGVEPESAPRRFVAVLMVRLRPIDASESRADPSEVFERIRGQVAAIAREHGGAFKGVSPQGSIEFHFGADRHREYPVLAAGEAALNLIAWADADGEPQPICAVIHAASFVVTADVNAVAVRGACENLFALAGTSGVFASGDIRPCLDGFFAIEEPVPGVGPQILRIGAPTGARNTFDAEHRAGRLSPYVNREKVSRLDQLRELWRAASAEAGTGRTAWVHGQGGSGKSRLVHEFRNDLDPLMAGPIDDPIVLAANCYDTLTTKTWWPVRVLLGTLCRYREQDPDERKVERIEAVLKSLEGDLARGHKRIEEMLPRMARGLFDRPTPEGYPAPCESAGGLTGACQDDIVNFLVFRSLRKPTVIVVDDVQWADSLSLGVLQKLSHHAPRDICS